ncbi:CHASE3 domain-containing protein [Pelomonas sp. CA6]|uniref:CHASE3 domain-containing protein n=1 Tax=Pelomonas sp. CA6 TaxID=2907999 RepID=UPI001F4C074E|nr:CHASE3 domain-containing protein [Pelomonas sp. CA6]MCH7344603.1 CHASE3 domain-containing protein [Pelomonas sp. CA6]
MLDPLLQRASRHRLLSVLMAMVAGAAVMGVAEFTYRLADEALQAERVRQAAKLDALRLSSLLTDAETAQRGYLITGHTDYLQPMRNAQAQIPEVLKRLSRQYTSTGWADLMRDVRARTDEKLSELDETVQMYQRGAHEGWRAVTSTNMGKEKMDAVRQATERLARYEEDRIGDERRAIFRALALGRYGVHALAVLSLLWLLYFLKKNEALHQARRDHARLLGEERDRLDAEVRRRTAELTDLADHLTRVREHERAHLARELHDELGALLTAAKLDLSRARRQLARGQPEELAERLGHMATLIDEGITLKRRIIEDLRPSALEHLGLCAALEILAREFAARSGWTLHLALDEARADAQASLAVYRLVQESLSNALQHAQATQIWLTLRLEGGWMRVQVRDDGRGFDPAAVPPGHHGLLGMRYRMESLGGTLTLASAPGQGTRIEARLPQPVAQDAPAPG